MQAQSRSSCVLQRLVSKSMMYCSRNLLRRALAFSYQPLYPLLNYQSSFSRKYLRIWADIQNSNFYKSSKHQQIINHHSISDSFYLVMKVGIVQYFLNNMADNKKVDFYKKCAQLKKQNTRREASIYSEYSQIRFAQYSKHYQASVKQFKEKGSSQQLQTRKADIIALGSLSQIQEFQKAFMSINKKKELDMLSNYARRVSQEKDNKKLYILNVLSYIKRVNPILKARNT